ncbi:TetR family transcriptional regulator [Falsarthrobacter nasiphocae]|uniref:AcrR family transcriptional regulator n=1 Tax=Falsarthrobacter nasiphocae TaxID=189863 RepID=A0AAE3YE53_9MICC|nr:TetR family transcriptional regulator [Falsarthrobacter nasiphocae]MDR6892203.1 AcrR family transcriptional regulator [Falsarthrobacter nasiphocae]
MPKAPPPRPQLSLRLCAPARHASKHALNRQRTRDAIVTATADLLLTRGFGEFTASDVAGAAGCSRRTFFNYFSSITEAALAPLTALIEELGEVLAAQPDDMPVEDVLDAALRTVAPDEKTARVIARLHPLTSHTPELHAFRLQGWDHLCEQLEATLAPRVHNKDPLVLRALVKAITASGDAGCEAIAAAHRENPTAPLRPVLVDTVDRMMSLFLAGLGPHLDHPNFSSTPTES